MHIMIHLPKVRGGSIARSVRALHNIIGYIFKKTSAR